MRGRRRGQDTKDKILDEAGKVFAEKGYRDATHVEICKRSQTNVAAINYYFGSKEALYRAVFESLEEKTESLYPLNGGLSPDSAPEKRLRAFVHAHISRMFDPERLGNLHRIRMAEMFDPTGLLKESFERHLARNREQILSVLRDLLGPGASKRDLEWCEASIVGQCFMMAPGPRDEGPRAIFGFQAKDVEHLTEHIMQFSLAGIKATRRKIQKRSG